MKTSAAESCFRPHLDGFEIKYELPQEQSCGIFMLILRGRILENLKSDVFLTFFAAWSPALTHRRAAAERPRL